jgi:hypothetical protein
MVFDLGNLFLGQPPWARVVKTILKDFMSTNYGEYSSKARLTFLLTGAHEWNAGGQNLTGTGKLRAIRPCLFPNRPNHELWTDHTYRNTLNCAIISNGTSDFVENDGPFPPFLKPNAYDRAMQVYHFRERERKIATIRQERGATRKFGQITDGELAQHSSFFSFPTLSVFWIRHGHITVLKAAKGQYYNSQLSLLQLHVTISNFINF